MGTLPEITVETEKNGYIVGSVKASSFTMSYACFGSGRRNFIILPGVSIKKVTPSAPAIKAQYSLLLEKYTVWVFDRIDRAPEDYSVRDMAADTAAAMDALGIKSAVAYGVSQGGMIAQYLAIDYPRLVDALVLGSTFAKFNSTYIDIAEKWVKLAESRQERSLAELFGQAVYSPEIWSKYGEGVIAANSNITDEEYRQFIIMSKAIFTFDCTGEINKITCPAIVIGSEGDRAVDPAGSYELAELLGCEIYMYGTEYGHGVYDEAPDYVQRVLDFLNRI